MSYTADHAGALADVKAAGSAVTFTLSNPGTYTPATGAFTGASTTTVAGYAIRTKGDPRKYVALDLIESEAPTLLVVPTTYGDLPALGSVVSFGGVSYTVRDVQPVDPDGNGAIVARCVVAR